MMTDVVLIDVEMKDKIAQLNIRDFKYKIVEKEESVLCQGYGYFKIINGEKQLVALYAYNFELFFYFGKLINLSNNENISTILKEGLIDNTFKIYQHDNLIAEFIYKPTTYDAGVIEEVNDVLNDSKFSNLRINNTVKILSETNPEKRAQVDRECILKLNEARSRY